MATCHNIGMNIQEQGVRFGDLIRRLRVGHEKPQKEVAAATGVDQTILSRIESGARLPTKNQLEALATYFNVPAAQLVAIAQLERQERMFDRKRLAAAGAGAGAGMAALAGLGVATANPWVAASLLAATTSLGGVVARSSTDKRATSASAESPAADIDSASDEVLWEAEALARTANECVLRLVELSQSADSTVSTRCNELLVRLARQFEAESR